MDMNTTVATLSGNRIRVSRVGIPMDVLTSALQMLRAGELRLTAKCATMYLPRGGDPSNYEDLLSHPANKPVDVLIYESLDPAKRSFAFIEVKYDLPANPESVRDIQRRGMQLLSIVMDNYIKSGNLDNLADDKMRSLLYKMKVLKRGDEFRGASHFTSLGDLSDFRMPELVAGFPKMAPLLQEFSIRRVKQCAGNRFFNILLDIKQGDFQTFGIHPVLDLITNSGVLARAPYISFHPDHHANPLRNASNFVYALVGGYGRRNDVCWEDVFEKNKGLYTKGIRYKLGNSCERTNYPEAGLSDMTTALSPEYSLALL